MTIDFDAFDEQLRAARAELGTVVEHAWRDLARFERENRPSEQERERLQQAALRGDLGDDMRELANRIDRGEDTWDAVFSGQSPNIHLLSSQVSRMAEQNRQAILDAIEEDDDFDPARPPDDV